MSDPQNKTYLSFTSYQILTFYTFSSNKKKPNHQTPQLIAGHLSIFKVMLHFRWWKKWNKLKWNNLLDWCQPCSSRQNAFILGWISDKKCEIHLGWGKNPKIHVIRSNLLQNRSLVDGTWGNSNGIKEKPFKECVAVHKPS